MFVDLWSNSNQCFVLVHTVLKIATSMKRCLIHESKFLKQLEMRGWFSVDQYFEYKLSDVKCKTSLWGQVILFSVFSGAADWSEKQRREPGWWFAGVQQGHAEMKMPAVTTEPLTSYYYNWHALSCCTSEKTTRTAIQFPSRPTLPSILATLHLGCSAWSWSCLLQMGTNRLKVRHCYIYRYINNDMIL